MEEASAVRNFSWAGHSTQLAAALRRNMTAGGADLLLSCQVIATNFLPYLAWLSFVPLCFLLVFNTCSPKVSSLLFQILNISTIIHLIFNIA